MNKEDEFNKLIISTLKFTDSDVKKSKDTIEFLLDQNDESDKLRFFLNSTPRTRGKNYEKACKSEKHHVIAYFTSRLLSGECEFNFWKQLYDIGLIDTDISNLKKGQPSGLILPKNIGGLFWLAEAYNIDWEKYTEDQTKLKCCLKNKLNIQKLNCN